MENAIDSSEPFDTATHAELGLMQGFPPPPDRRVTRLNGLWTPPFNRWAYQNMRSLWPTASIRPADLPRDLPRKTDDGIASLSVTRRDGTQASFDEFLRQTFTDSLTVVHGDTVVYQRYLNGMTENTPHIMFSCTKSFIGFFALTAIEEGRVARDTPLTDILPELKGTGFDDALFEHVLDMTASIDFTEEYSVPDAEIHDYTAILGAGVKADQPLVAADLLAYARTLGPRSERAHGAVFEYQTPQADVLNWAVNRIYGQSFVALLESRIWQPLGMCGEANIMLDPAGNIFAGGGLSATANDMARFAAMLVQGGRIEGAEVVPGSVLNTLSEGGSKEAFLAGPVAEESMANGQWSYCAQWWVRHQPGSEAIIGIGVNGQWIYIDRVRKVAVIKQSSQPEADSWYFHDFTINAIDAVVRHAAGG